MNEFIYDEPILGLRLDSWLKEKMPEYSRTQIQKLIGSGNILVNGKQTLDSYRLKNGDMVKVADNNDRLEQEGAVKGEDIKLSVLYEDEYIIAIDKPRGMTVHPAAGTNSGTLVNALIGRYEENLSDVSGAGRPGIVHRLDKDTSGVIVVAKSNRAHLILSKAFSDRNVKKVYNTIVCGNVQHDSGKIDLPIGRDPHNRKKMSVVRQGGREAVTFFETVERFGDFTWLKIDLITGRTHQIRAHLAYIGHPVAGDKVYGPGQKVFKNYGQILHSTKIEFAHPVTGKIIQIGSPLPQYFIDALEKLMGHTSDPVR